jgi:tetratricopeptide (TPR) repeat protein
VLRGVGRARKEIKSGTRQRRRPNPERSDVCVATNRCPFCHDEIGRSIQWLICEHCLARHHEPCWDEATRCSACGHGRRLRRRRTKLKRSVRSPALPVLIAGAAVVFLILIAAAFVRTQAQRTQELDAALAAGKKEAIGSADQKAKLRAAEEALREAALDRMARSDVVRLDPAVEMALEAERLAEQKAERERREREALREEVEPLMRSAKRAFRADNYARALDRYARVLSLDPKHADAHHSRGVILVRLGDIEGALAACNLALAIAPTFAPALVTRGNAKRKENDLEGALADFGAALAIESHQQEALNNRGVVLDLLGRHDEAVEAFDAALKLSPSDPAIERNRAAALDKRDR